MSRLRRFGLRLVNLILPGRAERQLAREMDAHLALLQDKFERAGMTPDQARREARRAFGGVEQAKEYQRDARSFRWVEDARRDIAYAFRTLRRAPGFTVVATLTLALGVGAVTVIYSLLRNVLLDPFPYKHSQRMVDVVLRGENGRPVRGPYFPAPEFLDYQENTPAFEDVVGTSIEPMHYVGDAGAERLMTAWMTPNGFSFLGVDAMLGRVFGPADTAPNAPPVAVMNYRTWVRMFGADPGVIGRTITLNNQPWTIVGVMPPRFEWNIADFWLPSAMSRSDDVQTPRGFRAFQARLRPGVSIEEAEAQLKVVAARRATAFPKDYPPNSRMQVITVIDWVVGRFRGVLYTLFGAVSLLLVIACCNVANMLLARATVREREITIRAALGAGRGRIVRQLLAESAILALLGAIAGCVLAYVGIDLLAGLMPRAGVPWETQLRLDRPVLYFALGTAVLATFLFGLFPALHSVRRELIGAANSGGRSATAGPRQRHLRSGLVIAEVALSIILLLGAGVLTRSFINLVSVNLGIDPKNLLVLEVAFPPGPSSAAANRLALYRAAVDRFHTIPGVESAAVVRNVIGGLESPAEISGSTGPAGTALVQFCSEQVIETYRMRLVSGRRMSTLEVKAGHKVALVSEGLVAQYLNGQDPMGRTIRLPRLATLTPSPVEDPTFTIVGVVSDIRNMGPRDVPSPQVYVPYTIFPTRYALLVRTTPDAMTLVRALRSEILALDRQVAIVQPRTLETMLDNGVYAQPRFSLIVLAMFASTGLLLVALGVYGVLAYTVSQQTREIAIRMALGGARSDVLRFVFRLGLRLLGIGVVVGLAAGAATNRVLASQLWGVSPYDPVTLASVVGVILAIGLCACWVPAYRAMRVQPTVALRQE